MSSNDFFLNLKINDGLIMRFYQKMIHSLLEFYNIIALNFI
jgi:hypothetical protein